MHRLDEARHLLADTVVAAAAKPTALEFAVGCRLAVSAVADCDLPPADVSAMDGYALRVADLARQPLPVAFEVPAGSAPDALPEGHVARIFTGAPVPDGADTVIMQEQAEVGDGGLVNFTGQPDKGTAIRRRGEVFATGRALAEPGEVLTPQLIALLAAGGAATVDVQRPPRVAVVATGSELVPPDATPGPGQIRDSNSTMLAAFARRAGLEVAQRTTVGDSPGDVEAAIRDALAQADLVVCSGGVSVGDHDHVPAAVRAVGGEVHIHGVRMKPGKPILVASAATDGTDGPRWIVGLPGNAVSAMAGWRLFAWPIARVLAGDVDALREDPQTATLTETVTNKGDRLLLLPARHSADDDTIRPLWWKGSHDLATTARATALLRIPPGESIQLGDRAPFYEL